MTTLRAPPFSLLFNEIVVAKVSWHTLRLLSYITAELEDLPGTIYFIFCSYSALKSLSNSIIVKHKLLNNLKLLANLSNECIFAVLLSLHSLYADSFSRFGFAHGVSLHSVSFAVKNAFLCIKRHFDAIFHTKTKSELYYIIENSESILVP